MITQLLLDYFFRIPSDQDSVQFVTSMARGVCASSPVIRRPEPCTYVKRPVQQTKGTGKKGGKKRAATPEYESDWTSIGVR